MDSKPHQMTEFLTKTNSGNIEDVPCRHYNKFRCIYSVLKHYADSILSIEYNHPSDFTLTASVQFKSSKDFSKIETEVAEQARRQHMKSSSVDRAPNHTLNICLIYNEGDIHNENMDV